MFLDILFSAIFILGVYYLIQYRLNIKKAADYTKDALFPRSEEDFHKVLIPSEWKEMQPLSKTSKSYLYVKWGTAGAIVLLLALLVVVLTTDLIGSSFFSFAYFFFAIISLVHHKGNLYLLANGIILHGRYYPFHKVKSYEVEQIVRWHELYGLSDRLNNSFKLSIKVKSWLPQQSLVVIEEISDVERIIQFFEDNGISGKNKIDPSASFTNSSITNK